MNDFYITAVSNASMGLYPDNTLAHFKNEVPDVIELGDNYEIGLAEAFLPNRMDPSVRLPKWEFYKVIVLPKRKLGEVGKRTVKRTYVLHLKETYFQNFTALMEYINHDIRVKIEEKQKPYFTFKEGKFVFNYHLEEYDYKIELSPHLRELFGFTAAQLAIGGEIVSAVNYRNLTTKIDYAYIYCNLASHNVVGDKKVPLIKIITLSSVDTGKILNITFPKVHYFPLAVKKIQTIEFEIRTETGQYVPFLSEGRVLTTLHIRPRKVRNID